VIRAAAALLPMLLALGCSGGADAVPDWVEERAEAAVAPYLDVVAVARTEYVEGEREWRVINALDRVVPCSSCSRPAAAPEPQRGDTLEHRWDKRTRELTFFGFCSSDGDRAEPLSGCSTRLP
jgi:hypothetical protein